MTLLGPLFFDTSRDVMLQALCRAASSCPWP